MCHVFYRQWLYLHTRRRHLNTCLFDIKAMISLHTLAMLKGAQSQRSALRRTGEVIGIPSQVLDKDKDKDRLWLAFTKDL